MAHGAVYIVALPANCRPIRKKSRKQRGICDCKISGGFLTCFYSK